MLLVGRFSGPGLDRGPPGAMRGLHGEGTLYATLRDAERLHSGGAVPPW